MFRSGKVVSMFTICIRSMMLVRAWGVIIQRSYAPRQVGASMPVPGVLVLTRNGIRWQAPQVWAPVVRSALSLTKLNSWKPACADGVSTLSKGRSGAGGNGTLRMNLANASRVSPFRRPALPSSLVGQAVTSHMVVPMLPSTSTRVQLAGSSMAQFGVTSMLMEAVLLPP